MLPLVTPDTSKNEKQGVLHWDTLYGSSVLCRTDRHWQIVLTVALANSVAVFHLIVHSLLSPPRTLKGIRYVNPFARKDIVPGKALGDTEGQYNNSPRHSYVPYKSYDSTLEKYLLFHKRDVGKQCRPNLTA